MSFFTDQTTFQRVAEADMIPTLEKRGGGIYQCFCAKYGSDQICDKYKKDLQGG